MKLVGGASVDAGVSAYVVDGLKKERVKPILDLAMIRFKAFEKIRDERDVAKSALDNRKIIDQAKRIMMKSKGLSEEDAYESLRNASMAQNKTIAQIAEAVITAQNLMGQHNDRT